MSRNALAQALAPGDVGVLDHLAAHNPRASAGVTPGQFACFELVPGFWTIVCGKRRQLQVIE
jgi:hypothetical protein